MPDEEQRAELSAIAQQAGEIEAGNLPGQPEAPGIQTSQQAEQDSAAELAPAIAAALNVGFAVLAPAWAVTPEECQALGDGYAAVIEKYWPGAGCQMGPEITAVLLTAMVVGPRLGKPRKPEPAKPEENPEGGILEAKPVQGGDSATS